MNQKRGLDHLLWFYLLALEGGLDFKEAPTHYTQGFIMNALMRSNDRFHIKLQNRDFCRISLRSLNNFKTTLDHVESETWT